MCVYVDDCSHTCVQRACAHDTKTMYMGMCLHCIIMFCVCSSECNFQICSLARSHDGSKRASQLTLPDSAGGKLELVSLAPKCTASLSLLLRWQRAQMGSACLR